MSVSVFRVFRLPFVESLNFCWYLVDNKYLYACIQEMTIQIGELT